MTRSASGGWLHPPSAAHSGLSGYCPVLACHALMVTYKFGEVALRIQNEPWVHFTQLIIAAVVWPDPLAQLPEQGVVFRIHLSQSTLPVSLFPTESGPWPCFSIPGPLPCFAVPGLCSLALLSTAEVFPCLLIRSLLSSAAPAL